MNLRGLANTASSTVNPNTAVTILRSTGYTIGSGAKQVPTYASPVSGFANVQALDSIDLKQLDGLNIQGTIRAIYLSGNLAGVIRPDQIGGDIVQMGTPTKNWLVVKVLEHWDSWTKAAIVLQGS
jgi:hypothetical protein